MFDLDDKGFITVIELENALYELGIRPSRDDLYLLLKHFGKLSETRLRFGEFSEIFLPKREDYARLVRSRVPYNVPLHERRRVFSLDTLAKFTHVTRLHLESEGVAESLRQRLSRRAYFSLHDAFQAVDRDRNGFITLDEFQGILQEHGLYVTGKDLESLMERYDKNMDGRVSYSEFLEEVTPKSPRKY
jgi:Ca2+-binding EF-hand superfamily protein